MRSAYFILFNYIYTLDIDSKLDSITTITDTDETTQSNNDNTFCHINYIQLIWHSNINTQSNNNGLKLHNLDSVPIMTRFILFTIGLFDNYSFDYHTCIAKFRIPNHLPITTIDTYNGNNYNMNTFILLLKNPFINCQQQVSDNTNQLIAKTPSRFDVTTPTTPRIHTNLSMISDTFGVNDKFKIIYQ